MQTIRQLRLSRGLSQQALAEVLDIGKSTLESWESGRRCPSVPQLRRAAKFFGLCSDEIALVGIDVEDDRPVKGGQRRLQ